MALADFLALEIPPRTMLLDPILPERSLSMLYAPRGIGKSWLGLSIGVNATAIMHRLAGAKIHQRCWQEGPELGAFSSGIKARWDCPRAFPSWHGVSGSCSFVERQVRGDDG